MAIRVVWAVTLRREHRGKLIQLALPSCGASHHKSAMADLRTSIPISGTPEIGGGPAPVISAGSSRGDSRAVALRGSPKRASTSG